MLCICFNFSEDPSPVPMLACSLSSKFQLESEPSVRGYAYIDVFPTAGQMQLNRIVGAYSSAMVLVATFTAAFDAL